MPLAEGHVVAGRFRLIRELGRGGMGAVWLAHHNALDIPCAIKFIVDQAARNPEMRARFEREARSAAKLQSPNVVQILDHGVWEDAPFIVMELLAGEDLGKRLARVGRLSPSETLRIFEQVARALTKAHAAGIVHRDLKPDNIFLVRDDDREIAKVVDFGIAKTNAGALEGAQTRTGMMMGTPYYMSPEQAVGSKDVDHRSDLWALAVIAFECLTGRRPFESDVLGDLLMRIMSWPIPMPRSLAPDLPPAIDAWWTRAAARAPGERYQSAKELVESMAMALGLTAAGLASHVPSNLSPAREPAATPQSQAVPAGFAGVAPPSGMGLPPATPAPVSRSHGPMPAAAVTQQSELGPRRRSGGGALALGIGLTVVVAAAALIVVLVRKPGAKSAADAEASADVRPATSATASAGPSATAGPAVAPMETAPAPIAAPPIPSTTASAAPSPIAPRAPVNGRRAPGAPTTTAAPAAAAPGKVNPYGGDR